MTSKWVYVEEPNRGAPNGFIGLSKFIKTRWKRYSVDEALDTDPFAQRVLVNKIEDLWSVVPRSCSICACRTYSGTWKSAYGDEAEMVLVLDRPILSGEEAIRITSGSAVAQARMRQVEHALDKVGIAYENYGKTVKVAGNLLIRPLLEGWTEVQHAPRRVENYRSKNRREEDARRARVEAEQRARAAELRRENLSRTVLSIGSYADGLCNTLLKKEACRRLPSGFTADISVSGQRELHSLVRRVFDMSPVELLRKKALSLAIRAYNRYQSSRGSFGTLQKVEGLVYNFDRYEALGASRKEIREVVKPADERYCHSLLPVLKHLGKNRTAFGMVDPEETEGESK